MLDGLFITGTDTGVGKTEIGSQLTAGLRAQGVAVSARKPVESGCATVSGTLVPADALRYHDALGGQESLDAICPLRFAAALAPPVAARQAGQSLALAQVIDAAHPIPGRLTVVEGAGGFYSPLADDGLNADLATALRLPVLLIAADRLGCINHVLLTLEAIERRGLDTLAIVLNETAPGAALPDNRTQIETLARVPVLPLAYGARLDTRRLMSLAGHPLESLDHRIR